MVPGAESNKEYRRLNRETIKYMAVLTMTLNHFAHCCLEMDTLLYHALVSIGYFTAPVMCFFLAEGYSFTRSKRAYALRLAVFALISQLPFQLVFSGEDEAGMPGLNMLFTLLLCFLILLCREYMADGPGKKMAIIGLILLSAAGDWGVLAPVMVILFKKDRECKKNGAAGFLTAAAIIGSDGWITALEQGSAVGSTLLAGLGQCSGIFLAMAVLLYFYNGRKASHAGNVSKWFFYIYYPAHLLLLAFTRAM